jgi:hypothetical protein
LPAAQKGGGGLKTGLSKGKTRQTKKTSKINKTNKKK